VLSDAEYKTIMKRLDQEHLHPKLEVLHVSAGNRTRASAVGGEHSRKEPFEQLFCFMWQWINYFILLFFEAFLYNSRKYCPGIKETDLLMLQLGTFIYTPYQGCGFVFIWYGSGSGILGWILIRIQGFWWLKIEKKFTAKKKLNFFVKNYNLPISRPP
jgi:hypothetical protein